MRQKCIANPQRIVLPEAHDHRILEAASIAQSKGIANIILLGNQAIIKQVLLPSHSYITISFFITLKKLDAEALLSRQLPMVQKTGS
jgi:phosphotransacetylase